VRASPFSAIFSCAAGRAGAYADVHCNSPTRAAYTRFGSCAHSYLAPRDAFAHSGQPYIRSKIEIVWPHDNAPVREATRANVTAYLIAGQGNEPPRCDWDPIVHLWAAQNGSPAHVVATGQKRLLSQGGSTFPAWDLNDVDVSAARDPLNRLYFWASVDDMPIYSNIWAHGADARTFFPEPEILSSCR
jgi:hypothetical protein